MALVDKFCLALFSLTTVVLFFLGETGPNPKFLDGDWWTAYADIITTVGLKIFLPLWVLLRVIDAATGGPARRRGRFTYRRPD